MCNPDVQLVDKQDKMLGIKGLQLSGAAYAGPLDAQDYRVSPIYGSMEGLGKISLFIGTHDLLIGDCRKFKAQMEAAKLPFNYFEYPKMFHGWMVVPNLKESKHVLAQIAAQIKDE